MTKYKYSRLQLAERARHTEYSWSNLAEDLFAKAPTPQAGKECEVAHNGYGFDAGGRYEYDDIKNKVYDKPTAPTKQGKSNGLVCPDCLVEHCQHCKCEKCSKQEKEALGNQASGKVNMVKTWKELGEVMKGQKVSPPQNRVVYPHNDLDNAVRIDNQWAEDLQDSKPKKVKEIRGLTKTLVAVAPGTEYLEVTSIGDIRVKTVKGIKHGAGYSQVIVDEVSIGDITTLLKNK